MSLAIAGVGYGLTGSLVLVLLVVDLVYSRVGRDVIPTPGGVVVTPRDVLHAAPSPTQGA